MCIHVLSIMMVKLYDWLSNYTHCTTTSESYDAWTTFPETYCTCIQVNGNTATDTGSTATDTGDTVQLLIQELYTVPKVFTLGKPCSLFAWAIDTKLDLEGNRSSKRTITFKEKKMNK